jgi:capsule polysaccharide export protein KpsE/RkpR
MSLVSGEGVPEGDVVEVVSEVQEWLQSQPNDPYSHIPLRAALDSIQRYQALQLENEREKAECRRLRDLLRNSTLTTGHNSKPSRSVEDSLARIEEIKIEHTLASRAMEDSLTRIEEIEIAHALELSQLQSQLQNLDSPPSQHLIIPDSPEELSIDFF